MKRRSNSWLKTTLPLAVHPELIPVTMPRIEFWFEFASTYSYPAAMRIEKLAQAAAVAVDWQTFLLGPIFREQGWSDSPFNIYPAKGRYMWRDLERICHAFSIPFVRPSRFPRNGMLASRVACWFASEPWISQFSKAVFHANFAEDRDISDHEVLLACFNELGLDGPRLLKQAQTAESKAKLRMQTEHAKSLGIFGAPSFLVGKEMFWGNDRLEQALVCAQSDHDQG
jgi:2-hydroxychromene-2-carboxylate isomerase